MAPTNVISNNRKGFTLLESVISILLLSLIMLWSMQSMLAAYSLTSRNQIRDEAVRLAGETLTDLRNTPFSSLSAGTMATLNIQRQIRNYDQAFTVEREITSEVAGLAYSADVTVNWTFKGKNYTYNSTTIIADK